MFIVYGKYNNGVEFFPSVDPRQANVNIQLPSGTNIEKTNELTKKIEEKLKPFDDIEYYVANVGTSNSLSDVGSTLSNKSTITVNFYDKLERKRSSLETIEDVRNSIKDIAGGDIEIQKQASGPPTGPPVNIEISGDDFVKLGQISEQVKDKIKDVPNLTDLKSDFNESRPEVKITIDREKAALYKLSTTVIASTIRTAINGTAASKFRVGKDEYDITVRLEKNQRDNLSSIKDLFVVNKDNFVIPLTSVAKLEMSGGLEAINRKAGKSCHSFR